MAAAFNLFRLSGDGLKVYELRLSTLVQLVTILIVSGCSRSQVGELNFPDGQLQHVVRAEEIAWGQCPSNLPAGCEIALLEGNPQAAELFTVRFRLTGHFVMPPHTHPRDERVTVLKGQVAVAFGTGASCDSANPFGPGDYYVNARGAIHTVCTDNLTELQITGIGPW
jgi:quercetin dioxygenase-like cupin family protein